MSKIGTLNGIHLVTQQEYDTLKRNNQTKNLGMYFIKDSTKYLTTEAQGLTENQKAQVRANIGVSGQFSGNYNDLTNKPTNLVTTDGAQNITGVKNFTSGFTALNGNFSFSDTTNIGMEIGRRDGIPGTPYIDFHTNGSAGTDYNSRILASENKLKITANEGLWINEVKVDIRRLLGLVDIYAGSKQDKNGPVSNYFTKRDVLFNSSIGKGDIKINYSMTDYDVICILGGNDNASNLNWWVTPVWKFKHYYAYDDSVTCTLWTNGAEYWTVKISSLYDKTLTIGTETAVIKKITGIKL